MKVKLIIISIILLLVMVFACGCIPFMEKIGLINPTDEEQLSPEKGGPPDGLVKVLIGFKEKPGPPEQALVKGVGGQIKYTYHIVDAIAASIPQKAIDALQKNPNVRYVESDGLVQALDAELDNSWGVERIGAGIVHDSNKGTGVKVAIIDTGIDEDHPDLDDNLVGGVNFVSKPSWRTPDPNKWDDDHGHGTHVAGIIAAEDNDTGVVGVAPGVYLYAVKVLDRTGSGSYSDVIAAIEWCVDKGIQVTNNSYGSSGDPGETVKAAFDNSASAGVLHVAAAGNGGSVIYPAVYPSVIAVSATDEGDNIADFSSTGTEVELAAPGVDIYSTYKDGGYTTMSGTSMASPHVAGTAALVIWSGVTDIDGECGIANEVKACLFDTAQDIGLLPEEQGYGLVDAAKAAGVETPLPNETPTVSITSPVDGFTFDSGATILFEGTASDTEDGNLTASLVWTSNIDSQIGTGDSFSTTLSDGIHTITAEVTDLGGETGSASISITVGTPITDNMHVSDIYMSLGYVVAGPNKFYTAVATVTIVDASGAPVEGATVFGSWGGATTDTDSGITDGIGQVSLQSDKVRNPAVGTTFTFTVGDVTKDVWTYDSSANVETSDSITVPEE